MLQRRWRKRDDPGNAMNISEHQCQCTGRGECLLFNQFLCHKEWMICSGDPSVAEARRKTWLQSMYGNIGVAVSPQGQMAFRETAAIPYVRPEPVLGRYAGTNLALLLKKVGIHVNDGCGGCEEWISNMNREGPEWCVENKPALVERLKTQAEQLRAKGELGVVKTVFTGVLMAYNGMWPTVSSLVDLAISKAKEAQAEVTH